MSYAMQYDAKIKIKKKQAVAKSAPPQTLSSTVA